MRGKLLTRLKRLESQVEMAKPRGLVRVGWLQPLPRDFIGERHVAIVTRESTGQSNVEWCQFEERPGPAPRGADLPPLSLPQPDHSLAS